MGVCLIGCIFGVIFGIRIGFSLRPPVIVFTASGFGEGYLFGKNRTASWGSFLFVDKFEAASRLAKSTATKGGLSRDELRQLILGWCERALVDLTKNTSYEIKTTTVAGSQASGGSPSRSG
jgi:hypothetical protein